MVHERPNEYLTEIWIHEPPFAGHGIFCAEDEIIERGELFKIKKSFYPPNHYVYVKPEDLMPAWNK